MSENKHVLFIINKKAGSGYTHREETLIIEKCKQLNYDFTIEFTKGPNDATQLSREAAQSKKYEVIYAVGGDGTVNEVAKALVNTKQMMGIIPKGSGNGLARHLGITTDFRKSLLQLENFRTIAMDTMEVNGKLSVNVSGVGFDGLVASLFGKNGKRGLLGYTRLIAKEYFSYDEFPVTLQVDDQQYIRKAFIIAFANSSQFGNNATISPHASVTDGFLDICILKKVPVSRAPVFIQKMFTGHIDSSNLVEIIKGKKVSISFPYKMPYHLDGEAVPESDHFFIQIIPSSLLMAVPVHTQPNI